MFGLQANLDPADIRDRVVEGRMLEIPSEVPKDMQQLIRSCWTSDYKAPKEFWSWDIFPGIDVSPTKEVNKHLLFKLLLVHVSTHLVSVN